MFPDDRQPVRLIYTGVDDEEFRKIKDLLDEGFAKSDLQPVLIHAHHQLALDEKGKLRLETDQEFEFFCCKMPLVVNIKTFTHGGGEVETNVYECIHKMMTLTFAKMRTTTRAMTQDQLNRKDHEEERKKLIALDMQKTLVYKNLSRNFEWTGSEYPTGKFLDDVGFVDQYFILMHMFLEVKKLTLNPEFKYNIEEFMSKAERNMSQECGAFCVDFMRVFGMTVVDWKQS